MGKGQGKLSGFSWHYEFNSGKSKEYDETCIHLDSYRVCQNKNSYHYLAKCFESSHCKFKRKSRPDSIKHEDMILIDDAQRAEKIKQKNKSNSDEKNKCITLHRLNDDKYLELYINNRAVEELPTLHKLAMEKELRERFSYANFNYVVIDISYKVCEGKSFLIIDPPKNIVNKKKKNKKNNK